MQVTLSTPARVLAAIAAIAVLSSTNSFASPITITKERRSTVVCHIPTTGCDPDAIPYIHVTVTYDPDALVVTQPSPDTWDLMITSPATFTVDRPHIPDPFVPFGGVLSNSTRLSVTITDRGSGLLFVTSGGHITDRDTFGGCTLAGQCDGTWLDRLDFGTFFTLPGTLPPSPPTADDFMALLAYQNRSSWIDYVTELFYRTPAGAFTIDPDSRLYEAVPEPPLNVLAVCAMAALGIWRARS